MSNKLGLVYDYAEVPHAPGTVIGQVDGVTAWGAVTQCMRCRIIRERLYLTGQSRETAAVLSFHFEQGQSSPWEWQHDFCRNRMVSVEERATFLQRQAAGFDRQRQEAEMLMQQMLTSKDNI